MVLDFMKTIRIIIPILNEEGVIKQNLSYPFSVVVELETFFNHFILKE